jgi:undecaprenyl-diphosphatase
MDVTMVVLAVAGAAGLVGFAVSASRAVVLDPTGPIDRHPRVRRFLRERFDRQSRRGFLVTVAFVLVFGVAVLVGLLLDMVHAGSGLAELDDEVAEWGAAHASSAAVDVMEVATHLGGTPVVILVLVALAVYDYSRRREVEVFVFVAAVGIGQNVIANLLKLIVDRERPDVLQLVAVHSPSFPSGHSTGAAACWATVAFVLGRGRSSLVQALLAGGAIVIAVTVATSRALLGVHWLTDIVAGLAIGWGWFALVVLAFRTRERTVSSHEVAPRT